MGKKLFAVIGFKYEGKWDGSELFPLPSYDVKDYGNIEVTDIHFLDKKLAYFEQDFRDIRDWNVLKITMEALERLGEENFYLLRIIADAFKKIRGSYGSLLELIQYVEEGTFVLYQNVSNNYELGLWNFWNSVTRENWDRYNEFMDFDALGKSIRDGDGVFVDDCYVALY